MKAEDLKEAMKNGTTVLHKHYGEVIIERWIYEFNRPIVQPITDAGKKLLHEQSGAKYGTPLVEDNLRLLKKASAAKV